MIAKTKTLSTANDFSMTCRRRTPSSAPLLTRSGRRRRRRGRPRRRSRRGLADADHVVLRCAGGRRRNMARITARTAAQACRGTDVHEPLTRGRMRSPTDVEGLPAAAPVGATHRAGGRPRGRFLVLTTRRRGVLLRCRYTFRNSRPSGNPGSPQGCAGRRYRERGGSHQVQRAVASARVGRAALSPGFDIGCSCSASWSRCPRWWPTSCSTAAASTALDLVWIALVVIMSRFPLMLTTGVRRHQARVPRPASSSSWCSRAPRRGVLDLGPSPRPQWPWRRSASRGAAGSSTSPHPARGRAVSCGSSTSSSRATTSSSPSSRS